MDVGREFEEEWLIFEDGFQPVSLKNKSEARFQTSLIRFFRTGKVGMLVHSAYHIMFYNGSF
jgi:hypothetical protein